MKKLIFSLVLTLFCLNFAVSNETTTSFATDNTELASMLELEQGNYQMEMDRNVLCEVGCGVAYAACLLSCGGDLLCQEACGFAYQACLLVC